LSGRALIRYLLFRRRRNSPCLTAFAPDLPLIESRNMTLDVVALQPLAALIAGILILLIPRLLNYVVAVYLILIGLIGLWPHLLYHPH
jgi:hypothetical protein